MSTNQSIKRAVIYARYSTDLQKDKSIEDQIALCRAYAERNGYQIIEEYKDHAVSGASIRGRPGIQALLAAAYDQQFEVVLAELLSRIRPRSGRTARHPQAT